MTKVITEGTFNTSMGLILRVKNDRVFKVGETVSTGSDKYKIDRIIPSNNPNDFDYVGLIVSKAN